MSPHYVVPVFSFVFTISVALAIGVRLLLVARRTRRFPEAAIGAASLFIGGGGLIDTAGAFWLDESWLTLWACSELTMYSGGASVFFLSVWKIFRPDSRWAQGFAFAGVGVLLTTLGIVYFHGGHVDAKGGLYPGAPSLAYYVSVTARAVAYGWLAVESLLYHARLRRGIRFGLADPVIANQFLLWGICSTGLSLSLVATFACRALLGVSIGAWIPGLYFLSLVGVVSNVANWCAFFPPDRYRRWIRDEATEAGG
ncbi:MAG: hypothetical protein MJE66_18825 [Proteobacteria bacterium]|nr:hypothetical protein [Pseudomonadota bacterium]